MPDKSKHPNLHAPSLTWRYSSEPNPDALLAGDICAHLHLTAEPLDRIVQLTQLLPDYSTFDIRTASTVPPRHFFLNRFS